MRPATLTAEQRELLSRLTEHEAPASARTRIPRYDGDRTSMPLSSVQQRIWFFYRLQPEATVYNVAGAARLRGRLDADLLRRCLGEIVERHEILRTTYGQTGGIPMQTVHPFTGVELPTVDLTGLPEAEREAAARRRCQEETDRPFVLERDPMLRPMLLRLADDEHLLLICQHHIATDGWSLNVLIRELGERYSAHVRGVPVDLPELPVQYGDFAAWQRGWLDDAAVRRQLDYWRERLDETRLVDVATGLPRPTELSWSGGTLEYRIDPETVRRITEVAEAERATPYMALVAAQSLVLSRWSGQDDILIGCPVAGRRHAELEHLAGCFINEVVLRMDTSGTPTYRELLRQSRDACLSAYDHQDVSFERIIEAVTPERDALARMPLVRHQLGFHNEPHWSAQLPGLTFTIEPLSTNTARFDLEVDLAPADDGAITGTVYFSTDAFTEDVVVRMLDSLRTVLEEAGRQPDVPARELPVVGAAELARIGSGDPAPRREQDGPATVPELFEEQAGLRPDEIAVRAGDSSLTFRQLDERSNRLSWLLRVREVLPDQPVAVCLPPSPDLLVALLAVLKAGALAVPLHPGYPVGDLNDVLLDCSTGLVLVEGDGPEGLDPMVSRLDATGELGAWPADRPAVTRTPADRAFVNYPHTSSGTPRGLANTHAGVTHRLRWAASAYGEDGTDRPHCLVTGAGFDLSPWELLWAPAAGGSLTLDGREEPGNGDRAGTPGDAAVNTLSCTPSELAALLDTGLPGNSLRQVVCHDERPWPQLVRRLRALAPGCRIHLQYGPAHAALDVVAQPLLAEHRTGTLSQVGTEEPGAVLRVLDACGLPVPLGVPGELCLGGVPLPDGILGRPNEDRTLFADDPLRPGTRLFHTGLRARRLPDGTLDPLGEDIRVHTHQVEPSEVEAILHTAPEIERALITARPGGGEETGLTAHLTLLPQEGGDGDDPGRARFEEIYSTRAAEDDPTLNPAGWNSPQTGEYLTAAEMKEWADTTFRRILALRPSDVLEIGCKTGALLFRLAPRCSGYTATDLSAHALQHIRDHGDWLADKADEVQLLERAADDFGALAEGGFDTVVLNSLVQYFPDAAYLERVLAGALRALRPGGHVYLGAVRSLPLLGPLHLPAQLELHEAADPADRLRAAVSARVAQEEELCLDPRYFAELASRLPGISEVFLLPRLSRHRNELGAYRYDAVLRAGTPADPGTPDLTLDWQADALTADALTGLLREQAPQRLLLGAVPDSRVHTRLRACAELLEGRTATVADTTAALAPRSPGPGSPVDPHALTTLAEREGYAAIVQYGKDPADGTVSVLLTRSTEAGSGEAGAGTELPAGFGHRPKDEGAGTGPQWYNDPSTVARGRAAVARARRHLQQRLPVHAVPPDLLVIPGFPLGRSGAVDATALPDPDPTAAADAHKAPSTETESKLAVIWSAALGVDRVSVHADFFALGGHSLMGSEIMERVRHEYQVDVPLGLLFGSPTIAAVASYVDEQLAKPREAVAPIQRVDRSSLRRRRARIPVGTAPSKETP
ncbi:AMP-binding protein [Streptomyces sp. P01-B04]|uniref:non-ribosomal peptide synthetase n=1 Tax=Streptomyces poriferorum TaxID=2798799 RepID=UPI001C5EEC39|nr:class I SAM-dependent methyltransferase [Streptomyces poriferorum]MBW5251544.1 AMP-binding protein [Streptomyces poriferorum]MBW5258041.1 AMP-binding protein [Streptomyces poriferorum]